MMRVDLRTRIFLRALALLSLLILVVTLSSGASSVAHQRENVRTIYQGQVGSLALQMADLVLWDDRVALHKLLFDLVKKNKALGYAFIERDRRPYVFTFPAGVPKGLLGLGPYSRDAVTVTPFTDEMGGRWLDIAQALSTKAAVLHLGVNVDVLFWQAMTELRGVFATSVAALLVGALFAWRIAQATTREVRARQQAEKELRRNQDELRKTNQQLAERSANLERTNQELESFSYSLSHDLLVPLRAIDGFSRLLRDENQGKLDAEGLRLLNVVQDNTKKMARLIDDILDFLRIGRQAMSPVWIDMQSLVSNVWDAFDPSVGRQVEIDIKPLPLAYGDRAMLVRVFTNLLSNAIKFSRHKKGVAIEVGAIAGDGETIYYVRDNGVGFDMQYANKLFGIFQRLHGVDEFDGTGIGLATIKRVITRHGGRVWAEGKVGEGATFYFSLPDKERNHE